jgi:hypothetical protein
MEGSVNLTVPSSMMAEDAGHVTSRRVTVAVTVRAGGRVRRVTSLDGPSGCSAGLQWELGLA